MRNTLINKFKIFAMLSAFVILFSSCDNSTSVNNPEPLLKDPVSTLKDNIAGIWNIKTTLVEQNYFNEYINYGTIGQQSTVTWSISKYESQNNQIVLSGSKDIAIGQWESSKIFDFLHWVVKIEGIDYNTNVKYIIYIEFNEINPLKGIMVLYMEDPTTKEYKLVQKFELSGVKQ